LAIIVRDALQNRDLNLKLQRTVDELHKVKAGEAGELSDTSVPTYSMRKAKAKADEEALAEVKKFKQLYDAGATRLARLQQDNEKLKLEVEKLQKQNRILLGKMSNLEDHVNSLRANNVRAPVAIVHVRTS
jgi:hypothetical protein